MTHLGDYPNKTSCTKKRGQLYKGPSKEEAIQTIMNHLMFSPYHKLSGSGTVKLGAAGGYTPIGTPHWSRSFACPQRGRAMPFPIRRLPEDASNEYIDNL